MTLKLAKTEAEVLDPTYNEFRKKLHLFARNGYRGFARLQQGDDRQIVRDYPFCLSFN